jgi:hypothetical protein
MMIHGGDPFDIGAFHHAFPRQGWMPPYAPNHMWLGVVLSVLPVHAASDLWFVANLVGLGILAMVAVRALDRDLGWPAILAVTGVLLLSRPGRDTMIAGQLTVFYVIPTYVAWSQVRRRPWLAAVAVAVVLGKPPFGLPLLAFIAARHLWVVVYRAVAVFVAASLPIVVWLILAAGSPARLWQDVTGDLSYSEHNRVDRPGAIRRIDAVSLVARIHHGLGGGAEIVFFVLIVAVVAIVFSRSFTEPGWPVSAPALLILGTGTLLAISHQNYDLLLLTWPLAAAFRSLWPTVTTGSPRTPRTRVMGFLALPALAVTLVPAATTARLFGVTISTVSSATTVCLLVAMCGACASVREASMTRA